ncbi:hypothetical protein EDB89DRAFT_1958888 [Lactarius sanguifluus]|nr:hypothetical protein EDB89DRAFT_1958888 [Lactarius sanguifluus]
MSLSSHFSRILTARPPPPHWHTVLALLPLLPPPLTLGLLLLFFTLRLCRSGSFQEGALLLGLLRCGSGGAPGPSSRSAGSHSRCVRGGGCSAAGSRGQWGGGAVGTPSRRLAPQSRCAQLGVSETREEENCTFKRFKRRLTSWPALMYGVQGWAINSNSTQLPEQPELLWVQGGVKQRYWVVQASAQRITSERGSNRSKMRRSKVSKGARWCGTLEDADTEGNWALQSSEALREKH